MVFIMLKKEKKCVDLNSFVAAFRRLEQKTTEVNGESKMLKILLEDARRLNTFYETKETMLTEEKNSLHFTVNQLQQTVQEQCDLRAENAKLKNDVVNMKQQNERTVELVSKMRAQEVRHQRELQAVRQQCSRDVDKAHRVSLHQLKAKDDEVKKLLEKKDLDLEEMKKRLKDQEIEKQSKLLKMQMEYDAKLARVQSSAQRSQQHGSNLLPQSVFRRKLQFFQEEKNKEISVLRQRIKKLEENRRDNRLRRRKI